MGQEPVHLCTAPLLLEHEMDSSSANVGEADTRLSVFTETYEFSDSLSPSVAVAEAVAAVDGTDPTNGPVLHDVVETDALNALLTESNGVPSALEVSFEYAGHDVSVRADGTVTVDPGSVPTTE